MPQLVKGGKLAYGWSRIADTGRIVIPPVALEEYRFGETQILVMLPGSRTSGGFGLGSIEAVKRSRPWGAIHSILAHGMVRTPEGQVTWVEGKPHCWVRLRQGSICLPTATLETFGLKTGDRLLVIRGSRLAIAFAVKGPIVDEAGRHPELALFEP